jgi:hypothetical protein
VTNHNDPEKNSLFMNVPQIIDGANKTLLYVGGSHERIFLYSDFIDFGYKIDILEIWPYNVDFLRAQNYSVILGDVRYIKNHIKQKYDVAVWWHGPEHIKKEELENTLKEIESISSLVVLGCPQNDIMGQPAISGNPYEVHQWPIQEEDLKQYGYKTHIADRTSFYYCNHITAWKNLDEI